MGQRRYVTNNNVCIVDSSDQALHRIQYMVRAIMDSPIISLHNSPATVDLDAIKYCSLVIVSEIMDNMRGTEFVGKLYDTFYMDEMEHFPNIIFLTHLASQEIVRRLDYEDILNKIPSYRILQKPINPVELKHAISDLCPRMCASVKSEINLPKILSSNEAFMYTMKTIAGMSPKPITMSI